VPHPRRRRGWDTFQKSPNFKIHNYRLILEHLVFHNTSYNLTTASVPHPRRRRGWDTFQKSPNFKIHNYRSILEHLVFHNTSYNLTTANRPETSPSRVSQDCYECNLSSP
jgi:hypothetical protein